MAHTLGDFVTGLTVHTDGVIRVVTVSAGRYGRSAIRIADVVANDAGNGSIAAN